jgi:hypothetical protein
MKGKSLWVSVSIKVLKRLYIGTKWKMDQKMNQLEKNDMKMKHFYLIKKYFEKEKKTEWKMKQKINLNLLITKKFKIDSNNDL